MVVHYAAALLLILLQFRDVHGGGSCSCKCSSGFNGDSDVGQDGGPNFLPESRIFGGKITKAGGRPFQAGLSINGAGCGGSIYNSVTIITAAHCYTSSGGTAGNTKVYVGRLAHAWDLSNADAEFERAVDVMTHPAFAHKVSGHDIALVRLAAPLHFNSSIQPIGVAGPGLDLTGKVGVMSGWGGINKKMDPAPFLKEATGIILSRKECIKRIKAYPGTIDVGPKGEPLHQLVCVQARKGDGPAGQGICSGDSGGPLTCEVGGVTKLCGVAEGAYGCGREMPVTFTEINDPGIFKWVEKNAWKP